MDEFPYVILDADGVVDRVATEEEAIAYLAEMPHESLRYEVDHSSDVHDWESCPA